MKSFLLEPVGKIMADDESLFIQLEEKYREALNHLDGFSHINVVWWFDRCDDEQTRNTMIHVKPYKKSPARIGVFATRSPQRPNPIALTAVKVLGIDHEKGNIRVAYIDADDGTSILDIKPYTPSFDRVASPDVPEWCKNWPNSLEASEDFDWQNEFNF